MPYSRVHGYPFLSQGALRTHHRGQQCRLKFVLCDTKHRTYRQQGFLRTFVWFAVNLGQCSSLSAELQCFLHCTVIAASSSADETCIKGKKGHQSSKSHFVIEEYAILQNMDLQDCWLARLNERWTFRTFAPLGRLFEILYILGINTPLIGAC